MGVVEDQTDLHRPDTGRVRLQGIVDRAGRVMTVRHEKAVEEPLQSRRVREVLQQIAFGLSNREIAALLVVEESTIRTHVKRILMKLDLRDRVQTVIFAYETGLKSPSGVALMAADW